MGGHEEQRNEEPNKNAYVPPHRRNQKPNEEQTNKEPNRNKSSTTNWPRGGVRGKSENTSRFKRNWSRKEDSNSSKTAEEPSVKLNIEENSKKSDFDLYPHPFSARKNERKSLEKFPIPLEALREFITENEYEELLQAKENQTEIEESNWIHNVDFKVEKDFYINFKRKNFLCKSIKYHLNVDGPTDITIQDVFSDIDFKRAICISANPKNKSGDLQRRITAFTPYICQDFVIYVVGHAYFTVSADGSTLIYDAPGHGYINSFKGDIMLTDEQGNDILELINSQPNPAEVIDKILNCGDSIFCVGDENLKKKYKKPIRVSDLSEEDRNELESNL